MNCLDNTLLEHEFSPFQPSCEVPLDTREQSIEYRAYKECLISLKNNWS